MATLAEIRAKLQANENRGKGDRPQGDNAIYAHWNIPENTTARVRFLPDADPKNNFFWVERAMINLDFAGIKGQADSKRVTVKVPCVEMWGEACPILAEVRPWFKDPNLEEMGRKYWKKRSYLFQGFVHDNPIGDDKTPENPIRRFIISPQIFNLIKNALMDPEMVELPTDYTQGTDFRLTKTTKGQYADYSTSSWARKERSLNETELGAIAQYGLFNLNDFMPKKPTAEELNLIFEMFEASVEGELFDPERFGQFYKGASGSASSTASHDDEPAPAPVRTAPAPAPQPAVQAAPEVAPAPAGNKPSVDELLNMIRNRKQ